VPSHFKRSLLTAAAVAAAAVAAAPVAAAAGMKYMIKTTGYAWRDYKIKAEIAKQLKITTVFDKISSKEETVCIF
jgi:hypothetical protein